MIFAYAVDDRSLMAFSTTAEAIAYAEPLDVSDGNWLFFDERGQALCPQFPNQDILGRLIASPKKYILTAAKNATSKELSDLLPGVSAVEGVITSIDEVRKVLNGVGVDRDASSGPLF
jgi:hypothetical protein